MKVKLGILAIISAFLIVSCGEESTPTSPSSTEGMSGAAGPLGVGGGLHQETTGTALTTVGEIRQSPNEFQGQVVMLEGRTTSQRGPTEFLFNDGTGDLPIILSPGDPLPTLEVAIGVTGTVAGGNSEFPATIQVSSWEVLPPFSCDDIYEVRARFSEPGYAIGNVVGLFLSYRGVPPGAKTMEIDWDEGSSSDTVETFEIEKMGEPLGDGRFLLEGVVNHEYQNVKKEETKTVRAVLKVVGREGACTRVRDVVVIPASGPGYGGGGTLRVKILDEPVTSESMFGVRGEVRNETNTSGDVTMLFQTPEKSTIVEAGDYQCKILDAEFVECLLSNVEAGGSQSRIVHYKAPKVTSPTEIEGAVGLIAGDFTPVAKYTVTVQEK